MRGNCSYPHLCAAQVLLFVHADCLLPRSAPLAHKRPLDAGLTLQVSIVLASGERQACDRARAVCRFWDLEVRTAACREGVVIGAFRFGIDCEGRPPPPGLSAMARFATLRSQALQVPLLPSQPLSNATRLRFSRPKNEEKNLLGWALPNYSSVRGFGRGGGLW